MPVTSSMIGAGAAAGSRYCYLRFTGGGPDKVRKTISILKCSYRSHSRQMNQTRNPGVIKGNVRDGADNLFLLNLMQKGAYPSANIRPFASIRFLILQRNFKKHLINRCHDWHSDNTDQCGHHIDHTGIFCIFPIHLTHLCNGGRCRSDTGQKCDE